MELVLTHMDVCNLNLTFLQKDFILPKCTKRLIKENVLKRYFEMILDLSVSDIDGYL